MSRDSLFSRRKKIAESVKSISPTEQREIFKRLKRHNAQHTANINGVFFNITDIAEECISDIEEFLQFIADNTKSLERTYEPPQIPMPVTTPDATPEESREDVQNAISEAINRSRAETISCKRKETCKYQQFKKRYSKPQQRAEA